MSHDQLVLFTCGEMLIGVPANHVDRVIPASEISPLPNSPPVLSGVINIHGAITPVFNVSVRFGLPAKELHPDNFFILCNLPARKLALLTDNLVGLRDYTSGTLVPSDDVLSGLEHIKGIITTEDGVVIVQDLARFLSLEEERAVDIALAEFARE